MNIDLYDFKTISESLKESEIINKKLTDKENPPSLEDILDMDGIINEYNRKNEKLIDFFTKEKIKKMLEYIITEPKMDDFSKEHKYPFVCSKLLNINVHDVHKYFFLTNNEIIQEKKNKKIKNENSEEYDSVKSEENFFNYLDDEFNMDNIKENEEIKKDEFKENDEEQINYKDDKDKDNENISDNINDDKYKNYNINENKKDDEDDLVNHIEDDFNDKNDKGMKEENNEDNKIDEIKQNENMEIENEDKIEENKIEEDDLINYESNNDKEEEKKEKEEIQEEKINKDIIEQKNTENLNNEENKNKDKEINNDENNKDENEEIKDDYPEDRIELLDYLLSFLLTDSELNYVLCGYFSSLMSSLLNQEGARIIKYIYQKRKDVLDKLLYHSYRISISEIFFRILKFNEEVYSLLDKDNLPEEYKLIAEIKTEMIKNLFDAIDINMNTEKLFCIFSNMQEFTKKESISKYIINNNYIINSLIKNQFGKINLSNKNENDINIFDRKNNCMIFCDLIILWLNNIKDFDIQIPMLLYEVNEDSDEDTVQQNSSPVPELHHTILSQSLFDVLPNFIKNNFNEKNLGEIIIQSYNDEKLIPLGLYKIKIVELITNLVFYFRNIPNEFDDILIKSEFILNLINYIFKYPYNNFYQDAVFKFFDAIFQIEEGCAYHEKLFEYIFSDLSFLSKMKENFPKNLKSEGNSGLGFIPLFVSLSYKINILIGGTPLNLEKNYAKEGVITFNTRGKHPNIRGGISISFRVNARSQKKEKKEKNKNEIKAIPCLEKYCTDEWKYFFSEKISNIIKLYEEDLYDEKKANNNGTSEKDDDLFYNPLNDINNGDKNKEENEQLLGLGNKRYYDGGNKFNFEDDNNDKENMANFKDMEININDLNLEEEIYINKKEENNNDEFNTVNFWKNDLEKEKNSYVNIIGEEAMNELLDD